jgi:hypothetical protein
MMCRVILETKFRPLLMEAAIICKERDEHELCVDTKCEGKRHDMHCNTGLRKRNKLL